MVVALKPVSLVVAASAAENVADAMHVASNVLVKKDVPFIGR